ncbi:hypothetical protein DNY36_21390 [Salmonella enterica subsp. diarizonae]|nr:hypothetical protein [Salmonella enterica subsp. diarizonae]ECI3628396.1 hypothetical protein [Salmonella enterica subsp. diarizonae]EDT8143996.1 hypothetical protein [Salmonella enterica subsp. diarizonae]
MSTNTNNKLTDETLSAWKTEAKISLGETARDSVDYSHHEAILALVTEIQEHRKAAAEPVLYVMGMGCAFDAETASTCKGAVDSWVGEWNQEHLPGQEEYRTVPLYTAPPVQETGVYKDMLNIIGLLENNEWAEHCTSTVLGSLLESEITRLVGKEQPVPIVPDGYCIMPVALTAKNGAKWALSGEFSTAREVTCPECEGDGCSDCDGRGDWYEDQSIDWTTIKEIYRRAVEVCALPTGQTQDKIA